MDGVKLTAAQIAAIEKILRKERCAEVRPVKDGVAVLEVIRKNAGAK